MKYIKYNLIFAITALLWVPSVLAAPVDLEVDFEATPLFNEANFLPGSEISRWAKVKNNTPDSKPIIVEAINESDPDGLADVFEIGIYENGVLRYATTTLTAFFGAGEVSLSDLTGGSTQTQYDFLVRFVPGTDNSYQEKSLGFDILIGFKGDEGGGGEESGGGSGGGGGEGGGGGGGGGGGIQGLVINNERDGSVEDSTATITWLTSVLSTSRVIYDTAAGTFNFSISPNYGYAFSTPEFDTPASISGVTFHSVVLTGLLPGTTYYYRTISHASPDTVSFERSFTTSGTKPLIASKINDASFASEETGAGEPMVAGQSIVGETESIAFAETAGEMTADETNSSINEEGRDINIGEKNPDITAVKTAQVISGVKIPGWVWALGGIAILLIIMQIFRSYRRRTLP